MLELHNNMERFYKIYKFFFITFITVMISSCNLLNKSDKTRRVPLINQQILAQETISPSTKPQYAQNKKITENKDFYQNLFDEKKDKAVEIKDVVAENKITEIKKNILEKNTEKKAVLKKTTPPTNKTNFYVQIGAYSKLNNAKNVKTKITTYGNVVMDKTNNLTIVKIGPISNFSEAQEIQKNIAKVGFSKTIIIRK